MNKINSYKISSKTSIRDAFEYMTSKHLEICVYVDNKDKVQGIFTKGDLKRAVFKKINLDGDIKALLNKNFIYLQKNYTDDQAKKIFTETIIQQLPVINNGYLIDIIDKKNFFKKKTQVYMDNPVVIMAGGKGTRLDPFTRILPKPLIPYGNDAIIKVIMDKFNHYGVKNFIVSLNEKSKIIKAYFSEFDLKYKINFINETKPLGTVGSIKFIENTIKKPFFVTNCDIILRANYCSIMNFHLESNFDLTVVASLYKSKVPYGVCKIRNNGNLLSLEEKPSYEDLVNTGVYVFNPDIVRHIPKNKFMDINDLLKVLIKKKLKIGVYPVLESDWIDVGQWSEYKKSSSKIDIFID